MAANGPTSGPAWRLGAFAQILPPDFSLAAPSHPAAIRQASRDREATTEFRRDARYRPIFNLRRAQAAENPLANFRCRCEAPPNGDA
jgi:hypothetical protein